MKHLAIRSTRMTDKTKAYTCPGLGDRAHSVLLAYQYSRIEDTPVTLHITHEKYTSHVKPYKPASWHELLDMVPDKRVSLEVHQPGRLLQEPQWEKYLRNKGFKNAEIYYYKDAMKYCRDEKPCNVEISQYLKQSAMIPCENLSSELKLPEKYVTVQFDSTDQNRGINGILLDRILNGYRSEGLEIVKIGGDADNKLLDKSLRHCGYALANATYHVGADSGFMHLAQWFLPHNRIHLYSTKPQGSHHFHRALTNGSVLNKYL